MDITPILLALYVTGCVHMGLSAWFVMGHPQARADFEFGFRLRVYLTFTLLWFLMWLAKITVWIVRTTAGVETAVVVGALWDLEDEE